MSRIERIAMRIVSAEETVLEWAERHGIEVRDGMLVLYHGTPLQTSRKIMRSGLKKGSHLIEDKEDAGYFAWRDRQDDGSEVVVFKLLVDPSKIDGGHWAIANANLPMNKDTLLGVFSYDPKSRSVGVKDIRREVR